MLIALMLKNFLAVILKLCSMLGLQHHAQNYADVIYLGPLLTTVHSKGYPHLEDQRSRTQPNITPGFKPIL